MTMYHIKKYYGSIIVLCFVFGHQTGQTLTGTTLRHNPVHITADDSHFIHYFTCRSAIIFEHKLQEPSPGGGISVTGTLL